jgi:hypothetical protein
MKYRVYEVVGNDEEAIVEHGSSDSLMMAEEFAWSRHSMNPSSTFVVNYSEEDKSVVEMYFGEFRN